MRLDEPGALVLCHRFRGTAPRAAVSTQKERTSGQEGRPPPMHANALLPTALRLTSDCTSARYRYKRNAPSRNDSALPRALPPRGPPATRRSQGPDQHPHRTARQHEFRFPSRRAAWRRSDVIVMAHAVPGENGEGRVLERCGLMAMAHGSCEVRRVGGRLDDGACYETDRRTRAHWSDTRRTRRRSTHGVEKDSCVASRITHGANHD